MYNRFIEIPLFKRCSSLHEVEKSTEYRTRKGAALKKVLLGREKMKMADDVK